MSVFNKVKTKRPKRNKFNLGHERKFSFKMGELTPILCQEVLPGDSFKVNTDLMLRFAPMLSPVMHRVNVYTHYFFVPNRLVWDEWQDFITGGRLGTAEPVPPHIIMNADSMANGIWKKGNLSDYLGIPTFEETEAPSFTENIKISAIPHRAYLTIYNEYFRDQNLEPELTVGTSGGQISDINVEFFNMIPLRKRAWEKDYFTSALPFAQRGGSVDIPFDVNFEYKDQSQVFNDLGGEAAGVNTLQTDDDGTTAGLYWNDGTPDPQAARIENIESITGSNVSITEFRRAIRLQEWLEKNARGGARYIEQIMSHFGVRSSDARLQRPEYLGGGKQPIVISEVLNTTGTAENPQAAMAGHGIAAGHTNQFKRFFEEHGYIIGIMSVLPKTTYQQGLPRHFSRLDDKFQYYWPEFAHIGEQDVLNKEIFISSDDDVNNDTWGYQSRYSEYKYTPSTVHGEFRDTLDYWHMGRKFSDLPPLNANFVKADPTTRIFAVTEEEHMYCQLYNNVSALRPIPYFSTPYI